MHTPCLCSLILVFLCPLSTHAERRVCVHTVFMLYNVYMYKSIYIYQEVPAARFPSRVWCSSCSGRMLWQQVTRNLKLSFSNSVWNVLAPDVAVFPTLELKVPLSLFIAVEHHSPIQLLQGLRQPSWMWWDELYGLSMCLPHSLIMQAIQQSLIFTSNGWMVVKNQTFHHFRQFCVESSSLLILESAWSGKTGRDRTGESSAIFIHMLLFMVELGGITHLQSWLDNSLV